MDPDAREHPTLFDDLEQLSPPAVQAVSTVESARARNERLQAAFDETELLAAADAVGSLHEARRAGVGSRKSGGVFYTPTDVVEGLLELTLQPVLDAAADIERVRSLRVLDPACGSGNFLLAAASRIARRLEELGDDPHEAARVAHVECIRGIDVDLTAIDLFTYLAERAVGDSSEPGSAIRSGLVADAIDTPMIWDPANPGEPGLLASMGCPDGFDLVIGNPPFLNQLAAATGRTRQQASRLEQRLGDAAKGYSDTAMLFLLVGLDAVRSDGGLVCMIEPTSILSTRDCRAAREVLLQRAGLEFLWIAQDRVFDAAVDVCAPCLTMDRRLSGTRLVLGRGFSAELTTEHPKVDWASWAPLLATAAGIPDVVTATSGSVGDIARSTADFRDLYYGLADHVTDSPESSPRCVPLITSGLIDPATNRWGQLRTKFNKQTFEHPVVQIDGLPENLARWAERRLVPKLLVATQTKVLEVLADPDGVLLPSVPVITVEVDGDDLWRVAAVLTSPPVTAVAARRHMGAALGADALKLGAKDVDALPLPVGQQAWQRAAAHFRRASGLDGADRYRELVACASSMCDAYEIEDQQTLLDWWIGRLPRGVRGA